MIISILVVLMLVTISFVTTVSSNINTDIENRESPLFKIRTYGVINEHIKEFKENIKTRFIEGRLFLLTIPKIRNLIQNRHLYTGDGTYTCSWTLCDYCTRWAMGCTSSYECTVYCKYPPPSIFIECD